MRAFDALPALREMKIALYNYQGDPIWNPHAKDLLWPGILIGERAACGCDDYDSDSSDMRGNDCCDCLPKADAQFVVDCPLLEHLELYAAGSRAYGCFGVIPSREIVILARDLSLLKRVQSGGHPASLTLRGLRFYSGPTHKGLPIAFSRIEYPPAPAGVLVF
ncbi:hypothetical protein AURDEDRAFT_145435 [Auricularia subglabra TFB-10046 SS5]|nr:hypothetical protein AURDEDRAFT_145435 [Auricularia subglabra TFB-10046 SS5]